MIIEKRLLINVIQSAIIKLTKKADNKKNIQILNLN